MMRHAGASGLQLHDPAGSTAFAVVAIVMPTPIVSNTIVNLTIASSSLSDDESRKSHPDGH
jgi:hypothetical protein